MYVLSGASTIQQAQVLNRRKSNIYCPRQRFA